jgi:hypothetical protein
MWYIIDALTVPSLIFNYLIQDLSRRMDAGAGSVLNHSH